MRLAEEYYRRADEHMNAGQYGDAAHYLRASLWEATREGNDAWTSKAARRLGDAYFQSQRYVASVRTYQNALQWIPDGSDERWNIEVRLAQAETFAGEWTSARYRLHALKNLDLNSFENHGIAAIVDRLSRNTEARLALAEGDYQTAYEANHRLADERRAAGDREGASRYLLNSAIASMLEVDRQEDWQLEIERAQEDLQAALELINAVEPHHDFACEVRVGQGLLMLVDHKKRPDSQITSRFPALLKVLDDMGHELPTEYRIQKMLLMVHYSKITLDQQLAEDCRRQLRVALRELNEPAEDWLQTDFVARFSFEETFQPLAIRAEQVQKLLGWIRGGESEQTTTAKELVRKAVRLFSVFAVLPALAAAPGTAGTFSVSGTVSYADGAPAAGRIELMVSQML